MPDTETKNCWSGDLLGYQDIGTAYTNLIKSIDAAKVISIEAGFGRGKTFFREAWAQHLREQGEVVIEIDAQLSDHSGDPVITFIGALAKHIPEDANKNVKKALETVTKYGGMATKGLIRAVVRNAADELIEAVEEHVKDQVEGMPALEAAVAEVGDGMSKLAGGLITTQLAAEQVRQKELPEQLSVLRDALTKDRDNKRIVIIVDELDRCHPEYAIALLEALKLVFNNDGFVFCLMVNADYLENIAAHRFGAAAEGERYLDKFVDLRLALPATDEVIGRATEAMTLLLKVNIPFGDDAEFSVERAGRLAAQMAPMSGLSMRQIKRVLLRVEFALRCYRDQPLDLPLLIWLAFEKEMQGVKKSEFNDLLPRSQMSPQRGNKWLNSSGGLGLRNDSGRQHERFVRENCFELVALPDERYRLPDKQNYYDWAKIAYLAEYYIPEHRAILESVHRFEVAADT